MLRLTAQVIKSPPSAEKLIKSMRFGVVAGLTKTAKEGQKASQDAIKGTFTTRGSWFEQQNKFGIKIKPATVADPEAHVKTKADWLIPHEEGTPKVGRGGDLAIPTDQVRRNKRMIIPRGQRPRGLGAKAFKLETKNGPVLAQRISRGPRKGLIVLYGLKPSVRIRKQSTFREPIQKVVDTKLRENVIEGINKALANIKY